MVVARFELVWRYLHASCQDIYIANICFCWYLTAEWWYADALPQSRMMVCRCLATINNDDMQMPCHNQEWWYADALPQSRMMICRCLATIKNDDMQMPCHNQEWWYRCLATIKNDGIWCLATIKNDGRCLVLTIKNIWYLTAEWWKRPCHNQDEL